MAFALLWSMKHSIPLVLLSMLTLACASSTPDGARPDDMSADEHREQAKKHDSEAGKHEKDYDPSAVIWQTRGGASPLDDTDYLPEYYYNPTERHLTQAEKHADHAAAHRAAAKTLDQFEQTECVGFKRAERSLCPLLGAVTTVEDIEGGVRFTVAEGVDPVGLVAHVKCHFAAGRKAGREGMPHCPLYLKDLEVQKIGDNTIEIRSADTSQVTALRERMREHVSQ